MKRCFPLRDSRGRLGDAGVGAFELSELATGAPVFLRVGMPTPAKMPPSCGPDGAPSSPAPAGGGRGTGGAFGLLAPPDASRTAPVYVVGIVIASSSLSSFVGRGSRIEQCERGRRVEIGQHTWMEQDQSRARQQTVESERTDRRPERRIDHSSGSS